MGIKHLNQFVRQECPDAIRHITFADLAGKIVVVDASIYMYRFLADQALLENMYTMVSLLQMHGVVPVYIFDGKPPDEKRTLLNKRKYLKRAAEIKYNNAKVQLELSCCLDADATHSLNALRRRFIRLRDADFDRVKTLLQALGGLVAGAALMIAHGVMGGLMGKLLHDDPNMFDR